MHETPEGFLVCIGVPIARTGEMIYGKDETPLEPNSNGQVVVTRDEKEVFRPETIASFEGKPLTITHPADFVSPDNWKHLAKGVVQNVRRGEGDFKDSLIADLLVTDSVAINLIKNGLREVSCGYEADYTQIEDGKGTQINIVGNHLALVDQGRAGADYAINDSIRKGISRMNIKEKIKTIFARAQDEAMKAAEDAGGAAQDPASGKPATPIGDEGAKIWDEMKKMVGDLSAKMDAMKPKDAKADEGKKDAEKKDDEKTGDEGEENNMESRMKALEAAVAKLLENKASAGDEGKESEDADGDDTEDDDFEESTMTGDTASRVEILAPGMNAKAKDAKKKAILTAYESKDGKKAIEAFTGGKKPVLDSAEKIETLFIGASELLKHSRSKDFAGTKRGSANDGAAAGSTTPTIEEINKRNEEFYKRA